MRLFFTFGMTLWLLSCQPKLTHFTVAIPKNFDWQGHRGARGLLPENTIPAFLKALEYPIKTLELDVVITKDRQVLVSHEPWLSHTICSNPDGTPITESQEKSLNILQLTHAQIQQYDCGSRGNARFPQQQPMKTDKPLLREVFTAVEAWCKEKNRVLPFYNIEIKSQADWDNIYTPPVEIFAKLLLDEIKTANIQKRVCIQSFDVRALRAVRQMNPTITTAFLVENEEGFNSNLQKLDFVPSIYSPYYELVDSELVKMVHAKKMRLIPWTVNDTTSMQKLIQLGVDGIITDYPNIILQMEK